MSTAQWIPVAMFTNAATLWISWRFAINGSCFSNALLLPEANDEERNQVDDEEYDDGVFPALGPHAAHHEGQTHACRRTYILGCNGTW